MATTSLPKDFLNTIDSINKSVEVLRKIKRAAEGEGDVTLSWRECQTLIWFIQTLRPKKSEDG